MGLSKKKKGLLLLGAVLCVTLWVAAFLAGMRLCEQPPRVQIRYGEPVLSAEDLHRMQKSEVNQPDESFSFSAYVQAEGEAYSAALGKKAQPHVLYVYGDAGDILPARLLAGRFPSSADLTGCAVDAGTAYALWGSENVVGEQLEMDGVTYTVRGIFDSSEELIVVPQDYNSTRKFSVLVLNPGESEDPRGLAEKFLFRHALPDAVAVTLTTHRAGQARFFGLLPGIAAAVLFLLVLCKELWAIRRTPAQFLLGLFALLVILWGGIQLIGVDLSFPQSMIPTRWSDFEFWQRLFIQWRDIVRESRLAPVYIPDAEAMRLYSGMVWSSILASLLLLLTACGLWKAGGKN